MADTSGEGSAGAPVAESLPPSPAPRGSLLSVALAGLQAGMVGVLWMLVWLGLSASWQKDSFWKPENLFATAFYGSRGYGPGFAHTTFSGLSLYLLIYSVLGVCFAVLVRDRLSPAKTLFLAVAAGAAWYYLTFRLLWRSVIPLAFLWHMETPTLLGHLLYGTFLGRFPIYLHDRRRPAPPDEGIAPAETVAELPVAVPAPDDADAPAPDITPTPDRSSSPPDPD